MTSRVVSRTNSRVDLQYLAHMPYDSAVAGTGGASTGDENRAFLQAEFVALRAEIERRSTAQQAILVLYITGAGLVTTAAIKGHESVLALLVLPFICPAIAAMYIDHHNKIGQVGNYLDYLCGHHFGHHNNWEAWSREPAHDFGDTHSWKRGVRWIILFPACVAVALPAIYVYRPSRDNALLLIALRFGVVPGAALAVAYAARLVIKSLPRYLPVVDCECQICSR